MRGLKMTSRSVYHGQYCLYCHHKVKVGRAMVASTYYVCPMYPTMIGTQSQRAWLIRAAAALPGGHWDDPRFKEMQVRVVYHRACLERVLATAPVDPEVEQADFDAYRLELLDRFGIEDE